MSPQKTQYFGFITILGLLTMGVIFSKAHFWGVIQWPIFMMFLSISLGMAFFLLRPRDWHVLMFCFFRTKLNMSTATGLHILEVLSKTLLFGGTIGTGIGLVHCITNLNSPELIGPGVAISVLSMTYGLVCNYLLIIPAKLSLLVPQQEKLKKVSIKSKSNFRTKLMIMGISLILLCLGAILEGINLVWYISLPGIILVFIGPMIIYKIYASSNIKNNVVYQKVMLQISNLCISGAMLATIFQFIHLLENLDSPSLIVVEGAKVIVPMIYGIIGSFYALLKTKNNQQSIDDQKDASFMPYAAFFSTSCVVFALIVIVSLNA